MVDLDEAKNKPVVGPICEHCGKPSNSVYPCYVKRVRRGCTEMVKIYLCAHHFFEQLESDTEEPELPPPPPSDNEDDLFKRWQEENPDDNDEEEEEDDDESEPNNCNVDREGQSFG